MNRPTRIFIATIIIIAFLFGYLHHLDLKIILDFHRLHIFLFNLCTGGSVILFYADDTGEISPRVKTYFVISMLYALSTSLALYPATLLLSIPLLYLTEATRIRRFSFFPKQFFDDSSLSDKFLQASLCCLSLAIIGAACVVTNNIYLQLIHLEKLNLNVFFLGYSFPVSLLTISIVFKSLKTEYNKTINSIGLLLFWTITVGVIVFFIFILMELLIAEIVMASTLVCAVSGLLLLFYHNDQDSPHRALLLSAMTFLFFTGVTGLLYILKYEFAVFEQSHKYLLTLHGKISLYGWNLIGIFLAIRWKDKVIPSQSKLIIPMHWIAIVCFAPLGHSYASAAIVAVLMFTFVVYQALITRSETP